MLKSQAPMYECFGKSSRNADNSMRAYSRSPLGGRYMTPMVIGVSPFVNCTTSDSRFLVTLDAG